MDKSWAATLRTIHSRTQQAIGVADGAIHLQLNGDDSSNSPAPPPKHLTGLKALAESSQIVVPHALTLLQFKLSSPPRPPSEP